MALFGKTAGQQSFSEDYFNKPWKVFRVQDCTLGAVGGCFGNAAAQAAANVVSATGLVSRMSSTSLAAGKYAAYHDTLDRPGAAAVAILNGTSAFGNDPAPGNVAIPETFPGWPKNANARGGS